MDSGSGTILPNSGASHDNLASGQRLIILAILINAATLALRYISPLLAIVVGIAAVVLAIIGLLRLSDGLGYSTGMKGLLIVLFFIPLVSLITLLILNSRATKILREAGYRVGFFGASK